jgi:hypothetical protein
LKKEIPHVPQDHVAVLPVPERVPVTEDNPLIELEIQVEVIENKVVVVESRGVLNVIPFKQARTARGDISEQRRGERGSGGRFIRVAEIFPALEIRTLPLTAIPQKSARWKSNPNIWILS